MKIFELFEDKGTIDSAQALKSSFTPGQWTNIVRSLMKDRLNDLSTNIARENAIESYNREFGQNFYAQDPARWNAIARINGVISPTALTTWQAIHDFLAQHTAPVELTAAEPDPAAQNNTADSTPETFAEIQGWINGPEVFTRQDPEPVPNDLKRYIDGFIGRLMRTRGEAYKQEFTRNNLQNTMFGNYVAAANKIAEQYETPQGVTKDFVDTQLYAMMVSIDPIFAAIQSQQ